MRVVSFSVPAWFPSYEEPGAQEQAPPEDPSSGNASSGDRPATDHPTTDRPAFDRPASERTADAQLTEQESAVFLCLATGASNRELAVELQLSVSTVKFHVVNIRAKLGGISRLQACLLAALAREDTLRTAGSGHCARTGLSDGGGAAARR
ncbi:helix-turn-helix transcriptional regulator [Streptomyces avidinii]|uniref:response regulator transcription factor n=1 Tax=Streptomyces avidinii TaxID=1895 RepID=UPI00386B3183|nr:helix-turn-helix transcriptional regulator [Streptomyces avidinii]